MRVATVAPLALAVASAASAQTLRVGGLDPSRSRSLQGGQHGLLEDELTDPANFGAGGVVGRDVQLVPETSTVTDAYLSGVDVLFVCEPSSSPSVAEAAALDAWYVQGGHLVLLANSSSNSFVMNEWLAAVGAGSLFGSTTVCPNDPLGGTFAANAVGPAHGPFGDLRGATLSVTLSRAIVLDGSAASCAECTADTEITLATYERGVVAGGAGAIVVGGDPFWLDFSTQPGNSYYNPNNMASALNAFAWFCEDSFGTSYCGPAVPNSTGQPATLAATGSASVAANAFGLAASSLPDGSFGYFLASRTQGFQSNPGGSQGNLCLGGAVARFVHQVGPANGGTYARDLDLTSFPEPPGFATAVQPGETWNFQCWFRDANPSVTSNFTDGLGVDFQ